MRSPGFRFYRILPVLAFTRQHLDVSIHFHKRVLHHRGIFTTTCIRKKCLPYDSFHEQYGNEMIRYLDRLEELAEEETKNACGSYRVACLPRVSTAATSAGILRLSNAKIRQFDN